MRAWLLLALLLSPLTAWAQASDPILVEVTASRLNVRPGPMAACVPKDCPTQPKGARAVTVGEAVLLPDGSAWYELDYLTGADGWSNAAFLTLVRPTTVDITIRCDPTPCVDVEVNGVVLK